MEIAVLGGTGLAGRALATRLADLGHTVTIGSRDAERAAGVAAKVRARWGERVETLSGARNAAAAARSQLVVLSFPWEATEPMVAELAPHLAGKVVISMANALERIDGGFRAVIPPEGSVAATVARAAPEARVVGALHHVPAAALADLDGVVDGDVLVCSDDAGAREEVCRLVETIPRLRPVDAGGLASAVGIEAFTAVLLSVNSRYRVRAGLRLTELV